MSSNTTQPTPAEAEILSELTKIKQTLQIIEGTLSRLNVRVNDGKRVENGGEVAKRIKGVLEKVRGDLEGVLGVPEEEE